MARFARPAVTLQPSRTDKRPPPKPSTLPLFSADFEEAYAHQLDDESVILKPWNYVNEEDDGGVRFQESTTGSQCWQTTEIYEKIGEHHPHLAQFLHRDPWTAFPVLARPSGPQLTRLLEKRRSTMYTAPLNAPSSRITGTYLPLAYQWALHFISGLSFIHSHDIVLGNFNLRHCWLSSDAHLSLAIVGFLDASFTAKYAQQTGFTHIYVTYAGPHRYEEGFHPLQGEEDPTKLTDLFLYGCVVYELMTGAWPGSRLGGTDAELKAMIKMRRWPALEEQYMGRIVQKCWNGEFGDVGELKLEVEGFLKGLGWFIEGDDDLRGIDFAHLVDGQ